MQEIETNELAGVIGGIAQDADWSRAAGPTGGAVAGAGVGAARGVFAPRPDTGGPGPYNPNPPSTGI